MPRLRYLKSRREDFNDDDFDFVQRGNEEASGEESENSKIYEASEVEVQNGQSWLSNSAIVSSLSDARIKQAITHYKSLVSILENELCIRRNTPHKHSAENRGQVKRQYRASKNGSTKLRGEAGRNPEVHKVHQIVEAEKFIRKSGIKNSQAILNAWLKIMTKEENK